MAIICKVQGEKFTKRVKPLSEEDRKRAERKKAERSRTQVKRKARKSFELWHMHIRGNEGEQVHPVERNA